MSDYIRNHPAVINRWNWILEQAENLPKVTHRIPNNIWSDKRDSHTTIAVSIPRERSYDPQLIGGYTKVGSYHQRTFVSVSFLWRCNGMKERSCPGLDAIIYTPDRDIILKWTFDRWISNLMFETRGKLDQLDYMTRNWERPNVRK